MGSVTKVPQFQILLENRQNGGAEPPNFSPTIKTGGNNASGPLYNFGSGFSEQALLPNASKPIYITHISHNQQGYQLFLAQSAGSGPIATGPIEGNGTPYALNNGQKVDVSQCTICANGKF